MTQPLAHAPGVPRAALAAVAMALAGAGLLAWRPWHPRGAGRAAPLAANGAFLRDPELAPAMVLVNGAGSSPGSFIRAEAIIEAVMARNPADPHAVAAMALTEDAFIYRHFDRSQDRYAKARNFAEQAVRLAPDDAAACAALGICLYLTRRPDQYPRAQELLEKATRADPSDPFAYRFLDDLLFDSPTVPIDQAIATAEHTIELFPDDALSHYDLGRHFMDLGRLGDAEREFDRTIAIAPISNAIIWKAQIALWLREDPEEMRRVLERMPARDRAQEKWVFDMWVYAMASGKPQEGLDALGLFSGDWSDDLDYAGPIALLRASLLDLQGNQAAARLQYESALAVVKSRESVGPAKPAHSLLEAWCLHGLGRDAEARQTVDRYNRMLARPYIVGWGGGSWFAAVPINLILGNKAFALMLIREAATTPMAPTSSAAPGEIDRMSIAASTSRIYSHNLLAKNFDLDPRMAPWRNDPDILALLRARPVGAAASASEGQAEPSLPPEAAALMARTRQLLDQPDGGPDDLALADTLMAQATDLAPDSPDAWSLRGYVQSAYVLRNLDRDGSRLKAVQDCCSQALALNPNQTEAMLGLAVILVKQGAPAQAEALMRRAIQLQPDDRRLSRELARDLAIEGGPAETPDSHAGAAGRQALP